MNSLGFLTNVNICPKASCADECLEYQYDIINNTFGCPECKCICPDVDCDGQCGGKGLGIVEYDNRTGCFVCVGCGNQTQGESFFFSN